MNICRLCFWDISEANSKGQASLFDALFTQQENQYIRAARIMYKVPEKVCNHNVLRTVKQQNLGYIYKRRLASEMLKIVKDPGNHRLSSHFTIRETTGC